MAYIGNSPENIQRGRRSVYEFKATAGQTAFSGADLNNQALDLLEENEMGVYLNGIRLADSDDYSISGDTLTLLSAASLNDQLTVETQAEVANISSYTRTETDARYINYDGDIINGTLQIAGSGNNIELGDNNKAVFGGGSDLEIYHSGTQSIISDVGSGNLNLEGDSKIVLRSTGGSENYAQFFKDGAVELYYNNAVKLATTTTGIDVTGTVTSDGLTSAGNVLVSQSGANSSIIINRTDEAPQYNLTMGQSGTSPYITGNDAEIFHINVDPDNTQGNSGFNVNVDGKTTLKASSGGDISFYEDTGTTAKFFWDASTERLGLGTSSPDMDLHVTGGEVLFESTGNSKLQIKAGNTSGSFIEFADAQDGNVGRLFYDHSDNHMQFTVNAAERMRIDSSGHLLVGGTSSVGGTNGAALQVKGSTGSKDFSIALVDGSDQIAGRMHLQSTGSNSISIDADPENLGASTFLGFTVDGSEAMRIDSSGNLLVGTTNGNPTGNHEPGTVIAEYGQINVHRDGGNPLRVGSSADGNLTEYYKQGALVGSIGVVSGDRMYFATADGLGLQFDKDNNRIIPCDASGGYNSNVELGDEGLAFTNLFLTGGIQFDSRSNKLDDYEEGNFTPFMRINNGVQGITYNSRDGYYTKVGNLVTALVVINLSSKGTNVGGVSIDGLPFTVADSMSYTSFNGTCAPAYFSSMATNISTLTGWVAESTTEMYLRHTDGGGNSSIQNTNNGNINNNTDFRFLITYIST